jgi:hypothetical protein
MSGCSANDIRCRQLESRRRYYPRVILGTTLPSTYFTSDLNTLRTAQQANARASYRFREDRFKGDIIIVLRAFARFRT